MKEVKPILVIRYPRSKVTVRTIEEQKELLSKKADGYIVFFIIDRVDTLTFETFYPKDYEAKAFEDFAKEVKEKLEKLTP